jgi:hypothetical protein
MASFAPVLPLVSTVRNVSSSILLFRMDVSVSVPFCKRGLKALYALANSNRSAPYSDSSARNLTSEVIVFCTSEPRRSLSTGVREGAFCELRHDGVLGSSS